MTDYHIVYNVCLVISSKQKRPYPMSGELFKRLPFYEFRLAFRSAFFSVIALPRRFPLV